MRHSSPCSRPFDRLVICLQRTELGGAVLLLLEVALEVGGRHLVLRDGHARRLQDFMIFNIFS